MIVLYSFPRTGSSALLAKIRDEHHPRLTAIMEPFSHRIPSKLRVENLNRILAGEFEIVNTHLRQINDMLAHHRQAFFNLEQQSILLLRKDIVQLVLSWARARTQKEFTVVDNECIHIKPTMIENTAKKVKAELLYTFDKQYLPKDTELIFYEDQKFPESEFKQNLPKNQSIENYQELLDIAYNILSDFGNDNLTVKDGIIQKAVLPKNNK